MLSFYRISIRVDVFSSGCIFHSHRSFLFGEVHGVNSTHGAFGHALAAGLALGVVDIGEVVGHCDGLERTDLGALAAADTGGLTVLLGRSAFFLVITSHIYAAIVFAFISSFQHATRTSLHAGLATHALALIDFGKVGFGIDMDGVELAGCGAVTTAEAAERTGTFAGKHRVGERASHYRIVFHLSWGILAGAVTTDHTYLRFFR